MEIGVFHARRTGFTRQFTNTSLLVTVILSDVSLLKDDEIVPDEVY